MNRRHFVALVVGVAAWPVAARAQQQRLSKIGFLSSGSPRAFDKLNAAFHQGLSDEGFVEDRNLSGGRKAITQSRRYLSMRGIRGALS